jgi:hypothetical protein
VRCSEQTPNTLNSTRTAFPPTREPRRRSSKGTRQYKRRARRGNKLEAENKANQVMDGPEVAILKVPATSCIKEVMIVL